MFKKIFGFILGVIFVTAIGFYLFMMALWGDMGAPPTAHASTSGDYSKGQLRSDCEAIPANKRYLIPVINFAGETFNVSPALVAAMIKQESNFGAGAVSTAGAQGLMQVMPDTLAGMSGGAQGQAIKTGFHIIAASIPGGFNFTDPFNEATSIFFGTRYISQQITAFNKIDLALAAYNAGPGAVQQHGGIPPYSETINYVKNITQSLPEFEACIVKGSVDTQGVAARAISKVGKPSSAFCAWDPRNACASVVSDVLIEEGILLPSDKQAGVGGLATKLYEEKGYTSVITDPSDLQPGDIVFMNTHAPDSKTDSLYPNANLRNLVSQQGEPYHVGIWVENGNSSTGLVDNSTGGGTVERRGLWTPMTFALRR